MLFRYAREGVALFALLSCVFAILWDYFGLGPSCTLCRLERFLLGLGGVVAGSVALWQRFFPLHMSCRVMKAVGLFWTGLAGVTLYHTCLQYKLLTLPTFCQPAPFEGHTVDEMVQNLLRQPLPARCDEVTLAFMGIPAPLILTGALLIFAGIFFYEPRGRNR